MEKRILKSTVAVFICCIIYEIFDIGTNIPFYAGIAAIICTQTDTRSTLRVGINRTVGTLIGGFTGMGILFLIRQMAYLNQPVVRYTLISFCILPLMVLAEWFRTIRLPTRWHIKQPFPGAHLVFDFMRKSALTNITCVAFLSVTISHGMDISTTAFAWDRIIDTLIGVGASFLVNLIPHDENLEDAPPQHDGDVE